MTEPVLRPLTEPVKTFLEQITPPTKKGRSRATDNSFSTGNWP